MITAFDIRYAKPAPPYLEDKGKEAVYLRADLAHHDNEIRDWIVLLWNIDKAKSYDVEIDGLIAMRPRRTKYDEYERWVECSDLEEAHAYYWKILS